MPDLRPVTWRPLHAAYPVRCEDGVKRWFYRLDPGAIGEPLRWKNARDVTVGVDVFERFVDVFDAAAVFAVMASVGWSRFRLRTENGETMRRWLAWIALGGASAVALYNARHEIHCPPLAGHVAPPTPELRYLYDVGAPRVNQHLRGRAARRGDMGEFHWREWPLPNVTIEEVPRG